MRLLILCFWAAFGLAATCSNAAPGEDGFELLRRLIADRQPASPEALIAALPEELRAHYVLVFSSRSLQGGSFANPRAILFGSNAHLVVSFNGDPAQRGFSALETMEFDPAANRFLFREISFRPGAQGAAAVVVSEPNPARCAACHERPARPIWDVPPAWPGAYGERYGAGLSTAEARGMREFLARQAEHPRYRYLIGAAAFAARETFVPSSRTLYAGRPVEPPNARFSALLTALNVRFILSQLAAAPAFESHRFLLLAAAGGTCGALADFYPAAARSAIAEESRLFARAAEAAGRAQSAAKGRRSIGGDSGRSAAPTDLAALRFVVEHDLHLSTQHWTLAFERGSFDLSAPDGTITLEQALTEWLARGDPQLRSLASFRSFTADDPYCVHLRLESRLALAAAPAAAAPAALAGDDAHSAPPPLPGAAPRLLQRCIACHGGDVAPALPFADESTLAPRLLSGNYPRGRLLDEILYRLSAQAGADSMPRGMLASDAERRGLEEYFLALAGVQPKPDP